MGTFHAVLLLALIGGPGPIPGNGPGGVVVTTPPSVCVSPTASRPTIDGTLDPTEWQDAIRLEDFTQVEPDEGHPASERTEVLLKRDAEALYVAFLAHDSDMSGVRSVHEARDQWSMGDDAVAVLIDPFRSRTRAFVLQASPLGVQSDGVWSRQWDWSWDGLFESRGSVHDDHYVVEMAIPLSTLLGAGTGRDTWDVNFTRWIARKGERSWWAPLKRSELGALLTRSGELCGVQGVQPRAHLEVIPTLTVRGGDLPDVGRQDRRAEGVTLRVPALPWIRAEATYRPDFSFVESDVPQIAFNERYALFYPEKRPFFLEGQDQFSVPRASFDSGPLQLLHTRTIVRPRAGARVLATPRDFFLGGLATSQERMDGTPDGSSLVLRGLRRWRSSSQAGVLATRRTTGTGEENVVLSADAQISLPASTFFTAQVARSASTDADGTQRDGLAYYLDVAREGRNTFQQIVFSRVPADFDAALGFIPRNDLQQMVGHAGVYMRTRKAGMLYALPMYQIVASWDDAGQRMDIEHLPHLELMLLRATEVFLGYRFGEEVFRDRAHQVARAEMRISSTPAPWIDVSLTGKTGNRIRYDHGGDADRTSVASYGLAGGEVDVRVGRHGAVSFMASRATFGASDAFPARSLLLWRARGTVFLDNTRQLRVISQHDPDTDRRFDSILLGWEVNYGTQLHLGVERGGATGAAKGSDDFMAFLRVSYLWRL